MSLNKSLLIYRFPLHLSFLSLYVFVEETRSFILQHFPQSGSTDYIPVGVISQAAPITCISHKWGGRARSVIQFGFFCCFWQHSSISAIIYSHQEAFNI